MHCETQERRSTLKRGGADSRDVLKRAVNVLRGAACTEGGAEGQQHYLSVERRALPSEARPSTPEWRMTLQQSIRGGVQAVRILVEQRLQGMRIGTRTGQRKERFKKV
jgi:hypothetical protein